MSDTATLCMLVIIADMVMVKLYTEGSSVGMDNDTRRLFLVIFWVFLVYDSLYYAVKVLNI